MKWLAYLYYVAIFVVAIYLYNLIRNRINRASIKDCELGTNHTLQIHKYDNNNEVLHTCLCGSQADWGLTPDWCRICADYELEKRAREHAISAALEEANRAHERL